MAMLTVVLGVMNSDVVEAISYKMLYLPPGFPFRVRSEVFFLFSGS